MENSSNQSQPYMQAKPIAELLPSFRGMISEDVLQRLMSQTKQIPRTPFAKANEKILKPMTATEMEAYILAFQKKTPKVTQAASSTNCKKRNWNSSVKVEQKSVSRKTNIQGERKNVRKVLDFQQKPIVKVNETPKFIKPEVKPKKPQLQAQNITRMSGVYKIPQTPVESVIPIRNKTRMTIANKENKINTTNIRKSCAQTKTPLNKAQATKTPLNKVQATKTLPIFDDAKKIINALPTPRLITDTPLSNDTSKSSSDNSFLQKEKEIDAEEKVITVAEHILEDITEESPPASTPFKKYRSVQEYFNNTSNMGSSMAYNDNTIMCFDEPPVTNDISKIDEHVMGSLCNLFNKATLTDKQANKLDDLLQMEKQYEQNIKMADIIIQILINFKKTQLQRLSEIKRPKREIKNDCVKSENNSENFNTDNNDKNITTPPSVIKQSPVKKSSSKSPSYKVPKKGSCLRKSVICKSMPNISNNITPIKKIDARALNMYMKMKEEMTFLNTPIASRNTQNGPRTPAVTSHNLQRQLNKLFNESFQ